MSTDATETATDDDIDSLFAAEPEQTSPSPQATAQPAPAALSASNAPHAVIFDIETGPLPDAELWKVVAPFDASTLKPFPAFDESTVKLGNIKDPGKQAEKIEACRAAHAADAAAHDAKNATAEADYIAGVKGRAALSAITGRVLAIGYYFTEDEEESGVVAIGDHILSADDKESVITERDLLADFWMQYEASDEHTKFIGHNIHGFDLPFLIQRSMLLGVEVPRSVMRGRFFAEKFVDTMAVWACGRQGSNGMEKLDTLAKAFGVGAKNGSGAMFAELLEKDRAAAMEYLKNDIALTYEVAKRMRVCR
jgi:hypothetical protein